MKMNKAEKRIKSTYALRDLLVEVINEPVEFQDIPEFSAALRVQGRLAKWQDEERFIVSCSLNTLKTSAEDLLDGGYDALDNLRLNAIATLEGYAERKSASSKSNKTGLLKKVKELEHQINILEQQNMMMVNLVVDLKGTALQYAATGDSTTRAKCETYMKTISAKIGFTGNTLLFKALKKKDDKNIVSIKGSHSV
jgi:hypothetical protein